MNISRCSIEMIVTECMSPKEARAVRKASWKSAEASDSPPDAISISASVCIRSIVSGLSEPRTERLACTASWGDRSEMSMR